MNSRNIKCGIIVYTYRLYWVYQISLKFTKLHFYALHGLFWINERNKLLLTHNGLLQEVHNRVCMQMKLNHPQS
jgi:hypothetical protein